jgi:Cu(I)/Ag(I) efflux system membrane protein CusA/SilA
VITRAAQEVGPALFFSLLIITLSFVPVFTLQAQEGRLFGPLAFTKTYAMAAAAGLSVTLIPVLMGYWIRGRIPDELRNPINRGLIALYRPALEGVLRWPRTTLAIALLALATTAWPLSRLGGEFLPQIDEGDLLYMPSALPGLSAQKAGELLQLTNRMIRTVPEVAGVFGKAGRAETATDPAPLEMFETTVRLKPREQWRAGLTPEQLVEELDRAVQVPGLSNLWVPPIRNRIDMLATGIKSPIGVKVSGADLAAIDRVAARIEQVARTVPGVSSALAERLTGGRYVDVRIDRAAAGRYGLNIADVQSVIAGAIGGENVTETVEGLARFPVSLRYPREWRDTPCAAHRTADPHADRPADHAGRGGAHRDQRRPADAQERECPALGLGLCRCARTRPVIGCPRPATGRDQRDCDGARRERRLFGPVRVSGACQCAAGDRRAGDAADHLRAALSDLPAIRRRTADHGHACRFR